MSWTEAEVLAAVTAARYGPPWMCFPHFRPGTGQGKWADKAFDLFAFHAWPSGGYDRHVVEVKISRGDFLRELRDPLKRRAGLFYSTQFWFAAPRGVIRTPDEVPIHCGCYELDRDEHGAPTVSVMLPAPPLPSMPPTWNFLAAACRRLKSGEALAEVQAQLERALERQVRQEAALATVTAQRNRLRAQVDTLEKQLKATDGRPSPTDLEPIVERLCQELGVLRPPYKAPRGRKSLAAVLTVLRACVLEELMAESLGQPDHD